MSTKFIVNVTVNQKSSFKLTFSLTGENTNLPIDLTNYTVESKYKTDLNQPDSTAKPITAIISDAANGEIEISLTDEETAELKNPRYNYDVVITDQTGFKTRIVEGALIISRGVT